MTSMGFSLLLLGAMPLGEVFFVSPTGDDAAAGTIDAPWKTLAQAQTMLRSNANATGVVLRGGIYTLHEPLVLDARDCGTRSQPKVWSAFPGERPVISGGTPLQASWFSPITDTDVVQQLPLSAREHVLEINLAAHGVVDTGRFSVRGSINGNAALDIWKLQPSGLELFFLAGAPDDEVDVEARATFARWPNAADGWSTLTVTGNVINSTSFEFGPDVGARVPSWRAQLASANSSDVWAHGFWQWRWADAHYPLQSADSSEFTLGVPPQGEDSPCHGDCGLNKIGAGSGAYLPSLPPSLHPLPPNLIPSSIPPVLLLRYSVLSSGTTSTIFWQSSISLERCTLIEPLGRLMCGRPRSLATGRRTPPASTA